MQKGLTLTIRKVLKVKNEDDFDTQVEGIIDELESQGWVIDEGERGSSLDDADLDEGDLDEEDDDFDEEDDDDP